MDSTGGITATVEPGAAAGIAAIGANGASATSGTVAFGNGNGVTFGYSAGTMTGSVATNYLTTAANSTHVHSQYLTTAQAPGAYLTTAANSTHTHSQYLTTAANSTHVHNQYLTTAFGAAISASGGSQNTGTISFGNANSMSFGYSAGTITGSMGLTDFAVSNLTISQGTGASSTNVTMHGIALYAGAGVVFSTAGNSITIRTG
jgi:hypothetical protein